MTAAIPCQRWRDRRDTYRPAGELIDTGRYSVELVEDDRTAAAFVGQHHYSGTFPAARLRVGLFRARRWLRPELVGVAVFSVSVQQAVVPCYAPGLNAAQGVELGRFVLLDDVEANGETWFLARAFALLRRALPEVRVVIAYSDPTERRTEDGTLLKPGHIGTIYQAHNGRYLGRGRARTLLLDPRGRVVSERALSKVRRGERGADYAYRQLLAAGCPTRAPGEDAGLYVERVRRSGALRPLVHPGNHVYAWPLARSIQLRPGLPYPKGAP